MGSLVTSRFSAGGPPFFGLLFDYTESYYLSFNIFKIVEQLCGDIFAGLLHIRIVGLSAQAKPQYNTRS